MRILICDDQPDVAEALRLMLKGAGYQTEVFYSPAPLASRVDQQPEPDLVLMDMNYARDTTSGREGLDLLARIQHLKPHLPVVVMTAWSSVDLAVEAMRNGAVDFIQKPWENDRVLALIAKHRQQKRSPSSELEIARGVQRRLFPEGASKKSMEYAGLCKPAHEIGGDYYDFLSLDGGCAGFVLADVSGKGIGAALLMANLQASFRSQSSTDPRAILQHVNTLFYRSTPPEHYATALLAVYDPSNGRLRFGNCGHLPGMVARKDGLIDKLPTTATVLGLIEDLDVEVGEVQLSPGDVMLLYTDGITEAGIDNDSGEEFGEQALEALFATKRRQPIGELLHGIARAAEGHAGGVQSDDMTMLGLRVL